MNEIFLYYFFFGHRLVGPNRFMATGQGFGLTHTTQEGRQTQTSGPSPVLSKRLA